MESAIEDMHIAVTEEFQEPKEARGPHAGDIVVNDNGAVLVQTFGLNEVLDLATRFHPVMWVRPFPSGWRAALAKAAASRK